MAEFKALEKTIACIYNNKNNNVCGTGFLVYDRHLMTCAHVVNTALGRKETDRSKPNDKDIISISFPSLNPNLNFEAVVVSWQPLNSDGIGDIALLKILSEPLKINPQELVIVTSEEYRGHKFQTYGFPNKTIKGLWVDGELGAIQSNKLLQLNHSLGYFIQPGFSGAPVWDISLKGIVGMIVLSDRKSDRKVAFAIPSSALKNLSNQVIVIDRRIEKIKKYTLISGIFLSLIVAVTSYFISTTNPQSTTDTEILPTTEWWYTNPPSVKLPEKTKDTQLQQPSSPVPSTTTSPISKSNIVTLNTSSSYENLEKFLKQKQWEQADLETVNLTNNAAGHDTSFRLTYDQIQSIPCKDIKRLNDLWIKYSGGRFGFSKQRDIYLDSGGHPGGRAEPEAWGKFSSRVGWKKFDGSFILNSELNYQLNAAPIGHLPALCYRTFWFPRWNTKWIPALASHLKECKI